MGGTPTSAASELVKIGLVGGIFGKPKDYQEVVGTTPETLLAAGLRERGHDITVRGHSGPFDFHKLDVLHVHHLAYGAVAAACSRADVPFVFTSSPAPAALQEPAPGHALRDVQGRRLSGPLRDRSGLAAEDISP